MQTKSSRLDRTAFTIDFILFVVAVLSTMLYRHNSSDVNFNRMLFAIFLWLAATTIIVVHWAFKHHLWKGIKYAALHSKIDKRLNIALFDSGIYVERCVLMKTCAAVPKIRICFDDDLREGTICIRNCIKFDRRLDELPISSALPDKYVVSRSYIADNCNDYIYEFQSYEIKQLVFRSYDDFLATVLSTEPYNLFLDAHRSVPMFHALVIGQTGSGKSYCLYNFVLQMISKETPWELFIIDPKRSGLYVVGQKVCPARTACKIDNAMDVLNAFNERMNERKKEFCEKILQRLDSDYRDFSLTPICLVIDEFSSFRASLTRCEKKVRDRVDEIIGNTVREGRQLGCFVIIAQQQTNANNLPTELKENIPFKLILGMAERQTYITALGEYPDVARRRFEKGQGLLVYPGIATPEMPLVTAIATMDFNILAATESIICSRDSSQV